MQSGVTRRAASCFVLLLAALYCSSLLTVYGQSRVEKPRAKNVARAAPRTHTQTPAPQVDWTNFRGPNRDAVSSAVIRTSWPPIGLPELWRQVIGEGYGSMVVAKGLIFTIEQRGSDEYAIAYQLKSGRLRWRVSLSDGLKEKTNWLGPRPTPTWEDDRVFVLGATGELRCIDAVTGTSLWSHNILRENSAANLAGGMSAAPLVVGDLVIVLPGGPNGRSVVAYNKLTGNREWSVLNDQQAYVSPMLVTLSGQQQILVVSAQRVTGLAVQNGALLWEHPWATPGGLNTAQPIVVDDTHLFISSPESQGAALLEVTRAENRFHVRVVWHNKNLQDRSSGAVHHQGYIYGLDSGVLTCLDARTGTRKWRGAQAGNGQLLMAGGYLLIVQESGELVLAKPSPERFEELARFGAVQDSALNVPAISDGILLVRSGSGLVAFRIAAR